MANKKEKGKMGFGKKVLYGFGFLAIIAIIVVIIVISIPPNTDKAMELLNKSSTNSFLMSVTEKTDYDQFEAKVEACPKVNNYLKVMPEEMEDVQVLSMTLANVLEFYNDYMLFAQNNKDLKKNYKNIKAGFEDAMENQIALNNILIDVKNNLSESSSTYLQNAWINFRGEYVNWLGNYYKAISGLNDSYIGCMGNVTTNNTASTIILNTTTDFVEVLYNDFKELKDNDVKNPNASSYTYDLHGKVAAFDKFIKNNLENDKEIKKYYFDNEIKVKYKSLEGFYEVYQEKDMVKVIDSIGFVNKKLVVSKVYEGIIDSDNVFGTVKQFLVGGV